MSSNSVDLSLLAREAMLQRGLAPDFPPAAIEQSERLSGPAQNGSMADMRHLPWCSIDNDDSLDLDQLTVAEPLHGDSVRIHVAVADVDALVPNGTPIDEHARQNTTSVYTPTRIFPMLPERLSTNLTSLNPQADRVAMVISYTVGSDGSVDDGAVKRAHVRNYAKLAYNGVDAWLQGVGPMPQAMAGAHGVADQVRIQEQVAQRLNQRRHEDGALDLETIEPRAIVENGRVVQLQQEKKNRARTLIEDFMIAANGVTARFLEAKGLPSIRRVVRSPERWDRLETLAKQLGDRLPPEPESNFFVNYTASSRRSAPPLHAALPLRGRRWPRP